VDEHRCWVAGGGDAFVLCTMQARDLGLDWGCVCAAFCLCGSTLEALDIGNPTASTPGAVSSPSHWV
jgi:hypothetical protein